MDTQAWEKLGLNRHDQKQIHPCHIVDKMLRPPTKKDQVKSQGKMPTQSQKQTQSYIRALSKTPKSQGSMKQSA